MTALLVVGAVLTVLLAAYALGHYAIIAVFLFRKRPRRVFTEYPDHGVSILVPARNEDERALRVIRSLVEQDHKGDVHVYLLVKDRNDSSIPYFRAQFPDVDFDQPDGTLIEMFSREGRTTSILYAGIDGKSDKINVMASRLSTPYVGILDADHQAHPSWLRSSVVLLHEQDVRVVQGRREPISAHGFFPLWDSLHQHIGCELFNAAFTRAGLTVFFTGTTTVMETGLLQSHPLAACLTEDADFGYRIITEGEKIIWNPYCGSEEETSPDMYSFLARRRRWANGHTEAFFRHVGKLRGSSVSLAGRLQFCFHGFHYLVSLVVLLLHLVIGLFFVGALSPTATVTSVLCGGLLSVSIARTQRTLGWKVRATEIAVVFAWLFPAIVIATNLAQAALMHDFPRAVLPIHSVLQGVGIVALCTPLVLLSVGLIGFRQVSIGSLSALVLTYPVAFFIDISGVLLGMVDFMFGGARWRPVARAEASTELTIPGPSSLLPTVGIKDSWRFNLILSTTRNALALGLQSMNKPSRWLSSAVLLLLFGAGVMYTPTETLLVSPRPCEAMEHDGDPWIVPAIELKGYCNPDPAVPTNEGRRTGAFEVVREDGLNEVDPDYWDRLDNTFFCNNAGFSPDHVVSGAQGGVDLLVTAHPHLGKDYSAGSIATRDIEEAKFTYGRFEVEMKPPKASGLVTAMFLYRFDPWQEIDLEFVGRDTTKLLVNVFYNPGKEGDLYNYGYRGTPVLVDLGFDASEEVHRYAIEWEKEEIRWFVDDQLVHVRSAGRPTPIPHLPMRFHVNTWPSCSEELAGPFTVSDLPTRAEVRSATLSIWHPPPIVGLRDMLFRDTGNSWRDRARWIQP